LAEDNEDEVYPMKAMQAKNNRAWHRSYALGLISISVLSCTFSSGAGASAPPGPAPKDAAEAFRKADNVFLGEVKQ